MHISLTSLALVLGLVSVSALTTNIKVARDATVSYNSIKANGQFDSLTRKGLLPTLVASNTRTEPLTHDRILLGFDFPTSIKLTPNVRCDLVIPAPLEGPVVNYSLTASAAESGWEEETVNGGTRIGEVRVLNSMKVVGDKTGLLGVVDITRACQAAAATKGRRFSVIVDSNSPRVVFNSKQSGKSSIFSVDIIH
ncbi:hypothetical protein GGF37_005049 [Kickxella alabastrina]|nr:hypothetical protein GGF37_005049 [Kickxella alabastrina]